MVRSQVEGTYNLAIGEPIFLQDTLPWAQAVCPEGPFQYPHVGGEPELLKELQRAHKGMHVVVTVGAKQAISAVLYAYRELYGAMSAVHGAPYWPSYPYLIEGEGLTHSRLNTIKTQLRIGTLINNPDGVVHRAPTELLDCAYAHYVYGWDGQLPPHEVAVYSAAKLFGLSGLRVGWIVTADAAIAAKVSEYVERFTSGVCVTAQRHVASVLRFVRVADDHHILYAKAREVLLANGEIFRKHLGDLVETYSGVPRDGSGMFAWFKVRDDEKFKSAFATSKVLVISGASCGVQEPGWYRMSMGHRNSYTEDALWTLGQAL
jgi:aspartate/methionine/tyrosine aminotransferase